MTTKSTITIYEIDGVEVSPIVDNSVPKLIVKNHWNRKSLVILSLYGKEITVSNDELFRAIRCAEQAHRF